MKPSISNIELDWEIFKDSNHLKQIPKVISTIWFDNQMIVYGLIEKCKYKKGTASLILKDIKEEKFSFEIKHIEHSANKNLIHRFAAQNLIQNYLQGIMVINNLFFIYFK